MSRVTYANTPATLDQETLRSTHGVRVVTAAEEGIGVNALPKLASASGEQTIQIRPEPEPNANVLVKIPYSRISHHRQYAAPNQDGFTVTISNL